MIDDKFFILAYGRSGGSSLQFALARAIGEDIFPGEYFSTGSPKEEILETDCSNDKVREMVQRRLFQTGVPGMKLNARTFDYCDGEAYLMTEVIDVFGRVILNGRENLLKRKISELIAIRTNVWHIDHEKQREYIKGVEPWEEDVSKIREDIKLHERMWNTYVDFMNENEIPYYKVNYEDLYINLDVSQKLLKIKDIVDWLGFEFNQNAISDITHYLSSKRKVNTEETYRMIENIEEINEELGPKYGYLFE